MPVRQDGQGRSDGSHLVRVQRHAGGVSDRRDGHPALPREAGRGAVRRQEEKHGTGDA